MGKCSLRTTILPGPCLYLPPWSRQSSREPLQAQSHMYLRQTGLSTIRAVTARPGFSGMRSFHYFPRGYRGIWMPSPLRDPWHGKGREEGKNSWIFCLCTQVLEDFVDFPKSTEPRDTIPWTRNRDTHWRGIIKIQ